MLKKILFILIGIVGLILGYIALLPPEYTIARELTIKATPEILFPFINNSKKINSWNPWIELDPYVKTTFSGPAEGVGAKTTWIGGEELGSGSATIVQSVPNSLVKTKLEYEEPYVMTQDAEILLTPIDESHTVVRWSVSGKSDFIPRVFCFFMNMDKMIGGAFEKGLNNLKMKTES